jgi:hypothetical protein
MGSEISLVVVKKCTCVMYRARLSQTTLNLRTLCGSNIGCTRRSFGRFMIVYNVIIRFHSPACADKATVMGRRLLNRFHKLLVRSVC